MDQQHDKGAKGADVGSGTCLRCEKSLVLRENTVIVRSDSNVIVPESREAKAFYAVQRSHMQCVIDRLRVQVSTLKTKLCKAQTQLGAQQARADRHQQRIDDAWSSLAPSPD